MSLTAILVVMPMLLPPAAAATATAPPPPPPKDISQQVKYFSQQMVVVEAENFTSAPGSTWSPRRWGDDGGFFASTVANTFHSRRGYLHAPANASGADVSTAHITVKDAGVYTVLARYEQGYRFQMPFRLDIAATATATPLFSRTYGYREAPKLQAFGGCPADKGQPPGRGQLQAECSWSYGTTENIVWEGVGSSVTLAAGSYVMTLTAVNTTMAGVDPGGVGMEAVHFCARNVDAIVLHPNASDIDLRAKYEKPFLPLDGLFSQAGEVFFKVENTGDETFNLTVPYTYIHSPYFSMHLVLPISKQPGNTSVAPTSGCSRSGGPYCPVISTPAQSISGWVDVGAMMDTFNHGTWNLPSGPYVLHVGVKTGVSSTGAPVITAIGEFDAPNDTYGLQLVFDCNTRGTRRIRSQASDFWELNAQLINQTTNQGEPAPNQPKVFDKGKVPTHVPIYGGFWSYKTPNGGGGSSPVCPRCGKEYTKAQAGVQQMFGVTEYGLLGYGGGPKAPPVYDPVQVPLGDPRRNKAYIDLRTCINSVEHMKQCLQPFVNASTTADVLVVSLGDEIGVSDPNPNNTNAAAFTKWCAAEGHTGKPGCAGTPDPKLASVTLGDVVSSGLYYYSNRFLHDAGIARYKALTDTITSILPRALVGANYSPTGYAIGPSSSSICHAYLGIVYQWIELFRKGGMTMPWSEDWAWQTPIASQQSVGLMIDALRAGITKYGTFDQAAPYGDGSRALVPVPKPYENPALVPNGGSPPMLMYVMAHYPGNNPYMWKRQFYQDMIHGVKIFDLFLFQSSISGYTCDYVDTDGGSYEMVRQSLNELGMMDDIIWDGVAQAGGAKAAILYSDSADRWVSPETTSQGAAKRTLYVMLKHMGLPTDIVTEDDATAGHLNHYAALYIVDAQLSEASVTAIAAWCTAGGQAFISSGGGMLNEYNMSNAAMAKLLPVQQSGIWTGTWASRRNATIFYAKQDLPYAETLDEVTVLGSPDEPAFSVGVYGEKSIFTFTPQPADKTHLIAVYEDGSPAVVNITTGTHGGGVTYAGFHPGLAYFRPALPKRPVDRTPSLKSLTNFVPHAFDVNVKKLAERVLRSPAAAGARPVFSSNPLVELGIVTKTVDGVWNGTVIPIVDWTRTEGGSSGNGYTRVVVSLNHLSVATQFQYTTVSLASCGIKTTSYPNRALGCRQTLLPSCDHKGCNVSRPGPSRLNASSDNVSFSVDVAIADALIFR